jgi:hypothetical protein
MKDSFSEVRGGSAGVGAGPDIIFKTLSFLPKGKNCTFFFDK